MLCLDPSKRITARGALEHEYFKDIGFVPWFLGRYADPLVVHIESFKEENTLPVYFPGVGCVSSLLTAKLFVDLCLSAWCPVLSGTFMPCNLLLFYVGVENLGCLSYNNIDSEIAWMWMVIPKIEEGSFFLGKKPKHLTCSVHFQQKLEC